MIRERRSSVPPFLWSALLFLATLSIPEAQAIAQTLPGWNIVPPPPKLGTGKDVHQAKQSGFSPDEAYDFVTHESLTWDCTAATWRNQAGQPLGFDGGRAQNGEIIPPPPAIAGHQAQQSPDNPARAVDSITRQNLAWDSEAKTWRDAQTRQAFGFDGRLIHDECPRRAKSVVPRGTKYVDESGIFAASVNFAAFDFNKWKEVSGDSPLVVSNDATSTAIGFDANVGMKLPVLPMYGIVTGYSGWGLQNDAMLTNGHRVHNDVTDYGVGIGARITPGGVRRFSPWASVAAMYEWNKGDYKEFDRLDALILSEQRTHQSWTGAYGLGGTFWVLPSIGLDFGASYQGQFNSTNADEHFGFGIGLTYHPGMRAVALPPAPPPLLAPPPPPR